jgi:hypothetical protein
MQGVNQELTVEGVPPLSGALTSRLPREQRQLYLLYYLKVCLLRPLVIHYQKVVKNIRVSKTKRTGLPVANNAPKTKF